MFLSSYLPCFNMAASMFHNSWRMKFFSGRKFCLPCLFRQQRGIDKCVDLVPVRCVNADAAVNRKTSNSVKRPGRLKLLLISLGTGTLLLFGYRKYKANTEREPKLATNKQKHKPEAHGTVLFMMHVKQWSNLEVDLSELKTAKYGYLDCTRDILQIHVR